MPTDHTLHHMLASMPAARGAAVQALAADDTCDCGPSCDCASCGCGCG